MHPLSVMTFSDSAVLECSCHGKLYFSHSTPLADWPNNVSRVQATLPHTRTQKHTHTSISLCTCMHCFVCVFFSTRCLPHTSELHGEWNFPLFVNTYMKCLFVAYYRCMDICTYVRTWFLWRNKWPPSPQDPNLQHEQKRLVPPYAWNAETTFNRMVNNNKEWKDNKNNSANKPVALPVCFSY